MICLRRSVSDDFLNRLGLKINTEIGVIICEECECGIVRDHLESHLKKKHKIAFASATLKAELAKFLPVERELKAYMRPSQDLLEPVDGLAIYRDGYKCKTCIDPAFFCAKKATMEHHVRQHPGREMLKETCAVQHLFSGQYKKYFGVQWRAPLARGNIAESEVNIHIFYVLGRSLTDVMCF